MGKGEGTEEKLKERKGKREIEEKKDERVTIPGNSCNMKLDRIGMKE